MNASKKRYMQRHKKQGLCQYCNRKAIKNIQGKPQTRCKYHRTKQAKYMKKHNKYFKYKKQR